MAKELFKGQCSVCQKHKGIVCVDDIGGDKYCNDCYGGD